MKQTVYKNLPCDLTREEIAIYSEELAAITSRTAEIEAEKKEVMADFTAKLSKCLSDSRVLARKITTRKEDRSVECDLDFDYSRGIVFTVRTDTNVTIDQRKMSDNERQEWLDFDRVETARQEKEDAQQEQAQVLTPAPIIEEPEEGVSVCSNTGCQHYNKDSVNGCSQFEHAYECTDAVGEVVTLEEPAPESELCVRCHASSHCSKCCETCKDEWKSSQICLVLAEQSEKQEAEEARRDGICAEWRDCGYRDVCFTPENEEAGICFKDEPDKLITPASELTAESFMSWGYNRNEAKILAGGFSLVKYVREQKTLFITGEDPRTGWLSLPPRETYSAAERDLEKMIADGSIEVAGNQKGTVCNHKCLHNLRAAGFEFYRKADDRIKVGSGWSTWKKFDNPTDCSEAWNHLLTTDMKALED